MNVKSILCPVDYSDHSRYALNYAETIAKESDAELHVVHCYEDVVPYETGFGAAMFETIDIDQEDGKLHAFVPEQPGIRYQYHLIKGRVGTAINSYADHHDIDLIVIGTHGRTGLARLLMGSIAEEVLRHASCPVITIRQTAKQLEEASD